MTPLTTAIIIGFIGIVQVLLTTGVIWGAKSLSKLLEAVAVLSVTVAGIERKLDAIEASYVGRDEFNQATGRIDSSHSELKNAFWRLHDEHISCKACDIQRGPAKGSGA